MTQKEMATAFEEWWRWYEENPEEFNNDLQAVRDCRASRQKGELSYGLSCVGIMKRCLARIKERPRKRRARSRAA